MFKVRYWGVLWFQLHNPGPVILQMVFQMKSQHESIIFPPSTLSEVLGGCVAESVCSPTVFKLSIKGFRWPIWYCGWRIGVDALNFI